MPPPEKLKKCMKKPDLYFIFKSYFFWLLALFAVIFLAVRFIPLQKDFLGGGLETYIKNPYFWSWSNFDGEHYLAIARDGYKPLTYFFFPAYPLFVKAISVFFGKSLSGFLFSGIFVSWATFLIALIGLFKLVRLDYKRSIAEISIILLLLAPTSFYFASAYTESLFLALSIWFFYFARTKNYIFAGVLAGLATATRVVGIILPVCLFTEMLIEKENIFRIRNVASFALSISGIVVYMLYLKNATGNFLQFFNTISIFGEQREAAFITLPQVFYRYVFKVLPNIHTSFFPIIFSTWLEFFAGALFLAVSVWSFFKLRLSYSIFLLLGYIIPTLSGSFSSLPRYVAILFPAYILFALYLQKRKMLLIAFSLVSFILLVISFGLFARGYWIS